MNMSIVTIRDYRPQRVSDDSSADRKRQEKMFIGEIKTTARQKAKETTWQTVVAILTDDGVEYVHKATQ